MEKNLPINDKKLEVENDLRKDRIQYINKGETNIIVEEKENNDKNDNEIKNVEKKEPSIKGENNKDEGKDKNKENIEIKKVINNNKIENININGNNDKEKNNIVFNNEEFILEKGIIGGEQRVRRHDKYAISGYKNNEDNKCCIIF